MKKFSVTMLLSRTFDTYEEAEKSAKQSLHEPYAKSAYYVVESLAKIEKALPECTVTKL